MKPGTVVNASWSGIDSKSLNRIEYRLATYDNSKKAEIKTIIPYSSAKKIGDKANGSANISNSKSWGQGCYKLVIRGVDNGGIAGPGKGAVFYIDGKAPTLTSISINPATYTASRTPTLTWNGALDDYLSKIQYQVNTSPFVDAGTTSSGSIQLPAASFPVSGNYKINVRVLDKAGNISAIKTVNYNLDITPPTSGTIGLNPVENSWTSNSNPAIQFANIVESHSGIDTLSPQYCIVNSGKPANNYKSATKVSFLSDKNPYVGSFYLDGVVQTKGDGVYNIYVRFKDKAGNISSAKMLTYKKDKESPSGSIEVSANPDNISNTINFTTILSDTGSGIKNSSLFISFLLFQRDELRLCLLC